MRLVPIASYSRIAHVVLKPTSVPFYRNVHSDPRNPAGSPAQEPLPPLWQDGYKTQRLITTAGPPGYGVCSGCTRLYDDLLEAPGKAASSSGGRKSVV